MRNLSNNAWAKVAKGIGYYHEYVTITLADGTVLNLTEANLWEGGLAFEDEISNGDDFQIGSAMIGKCDITICNIEGTFDGYDFTDAVAVVRLGIEDTDILRIGVYTVNEMKYNGSIISLSCLDNMAKFDTRYSAVTTTYPATLGTIVRDICSHCSVQMASGTFDGADIVISARPTDEEMTCRQVIAFIAQRIMRYAKMDNLGRLAFIVPSFTSLDNIEGITLNLSSIFSMDISTSNVEITGISAKTLVTDAEGTTTEDSAMYGTSGYVLSISENPFIEDLEAAVNYIGPQIVGHAFRPLEATVLSNPAIEVGDVFKLTDRKGNVYAAIATLVRFRTGNSTYVQCSAKTPLRNAADRPSILTQTVLQSEKRTNERMTSYQQGQTLLSNLMANALGFYTTQEKLSDGSIIEYQHNKPTLAESTVIYKRTAEAFAFSTDGGVTWNSGWTAQGDAVFNVIQAIGLSASWIETGRLEVKDQDDNTMFLVDVDTGEVIVNMGKVIASNGQNAEVILDDVNDNIQNQMTSTNTKLASNTEAIGRLENTGASLRADLSGIVQRVTAVEHGLDGVDTQISTSIETYAKGINFIYDTKNNVEEIQRYIKFVNGNILLGRSDSELNLKIANDRISFLSGTTEVAYISNQRLYITDAVFLKSIQIGDFAFVPRTNGNLSFVKQ